MLTAVPIWEQNGCENDTGPFCIALSHDEKEVAISGWDGAIRVFCTLSGHQRLEVRGLTSWVQSIHFTHEQPGLVTVTSGDKMVRLWDYSGNVYQQFRASGSSHIACGAISFTSDMVVIGSQELKLWNLHSGTLITDFDTKEDWTAAVIMSSNNGWIATGTDRGFCCIWNTCTGEPERIFGGHTTGITAMARTSDNTLIVSGDKQGLVYVWSPLSGRVLFKKQVAVAEVEAVLFVFDNQHIAVATNDQKIKIFQVGDQDSKEILLITLPTSNPLCMAWSQTQNTLFVGDDLGALYTWNIVAPGPSPHVIQ